MLVPKLRFKEFTNEWEIKKLSDISLELSYGMNSASTEYDGENKYIRITDIDDKSSLYNKNDLVSPLGPLNNKFLVRENDILFARTGASTGKTYLYKKNDGKLYYAGFLIRARIKTNYNAQFIFEQFKLNKYKKWVKLMSARSGQPGINANEYGSYELLITSELEQQKIAIFFELLNKKIELQTKKIEALKLYKKGLLNYLINNLNNCDIIKLKNLGEPFGGLSGKSKDDFDSGESYFIPFMSVLKNNMDISTFRRVDVKPKEKQNKIFKGDLFFTISSETKEEVGMCSTINYDFDNLYLNSFCFGFRLNNNYKVNSKYLCSLLLSSKYRNIISNLGQGFTRINISKNQILDIDVAIPSVEEQNQISEVIKLIEENIGFQIDKLSKLQKLKKGLMNELFA